ncbi:hypothetical protein MDA_GLEAN10024044 [Myotis davidii]|uniref:Carcinoma-related EF-hand protein n=1 Tax=Myotis davidii TaxID=225400 RepID=L5LKJ5_MYODS|nr:hypothetical protein MDA_GLEAN10024044 [Myotis davidii]
MSSVQKTPRASGAMPETVVKIIGSKHFRYLVEKPKIKEEENLKAETQRVFQKSVTGNARQMIRDTPVPSNPTDHQITHGPDDVQKNKPPENNQKLLTGALGSRLLDGKDIGQRLSGTTKEDTFLLALVRRELKSHSLSSGLLDKLQKELKILDPIASGFLLQSQLSSLFLRHEVPLQLPTVKILCQRFARNGSPEMVNYEKLLCFLKVAASDDPQQNRRAMDSSLREAQGGTHHSESAAPQHADSPSEVTRSLLEILKLALSAANGKLNLESLSRSFRKEDHALSGFLSRPKVRAICGKHGLYLTLSLLETLLNHQDLAYQNEIKWQDFVELLSSASSDLSSDLPTGKEGKETPATAVQAEVPEMSQGKTEHMLFVSPVTENKSEECEMWIDRFRKLENALYLCDLSNTGVLEKERARRLIHNYNLIYNLSLSPRKIDQALRRFRSGENMLLEPALRYLKEL